MPMTIQKKAAEGEINAHAFLDHCNSTIVCDATSLCPKICKSGSDLSAKAPHPSYLSVMVPQQCANTWHGGKDGYCRSHTLRVGDRRPHSVKTKTPTLGAAARTRSLALRRKALEAATSQDADDLDAGFKPLTKKTSNLAKELTDEELLSTPTEGVELNVEGTNMGSEDLIEMDKKNSITHHGCVACCEFFLVPCGVCVGWDMMFHAESSSQVAVQFLTEIASRRDVRVRACTL
jgi:hypothetical protein